jgi:sporulation protein YlmC with PRC-barrel domain
MKKLACSLTAGLVLATAAAAQDQGRDTRPQDQARDTRPQDQGRDTRPQDTPVRPADREVTRGRSRDFAMATRTQKATDLMGKKVINSANENLGKLEDIVVDASSGRILYGVLSFGGFMGMGDKLFAIPWESLELPADAKNLVLSVSKDRLKNAEGFDKSQWPNFADEAWATQNYKYYDRTPYWQASDVTPAAGDNTNRSYRDRWYQRPVAWQKCSDLCGKDAHNMQNEDIGRISECLIDPESGRILYGVLAYSGKRFAIPWSALTLTGDAKRFQLNVTKEQLKNAPAFSGDTWPNVADERWAIEVHRYYNVQPYWMEVKVETNNR